MHKGLVGWDVCQEGSQHLVRRVLCTSNEFDVGSQFECSKSANVKTKHYKKNKKRSNVLIIETCFLLLFFLFFFLEKGIKKITGTFQFP